MSWRLAKSLETLRDQINEAYPKRNKASDGTIGDASHAASLSDHNPNRNGVVVAMDITHDPKNGFDAGKFSNHQLKNRHPNLRYLIFNKRIAGYWTDWKWVAYHGSNPHDKHVHVSVGTLNVGDGLTHNRYDSTKKWDLNNEREEMVTRQQVYHIVRINCGRTASKEELAKYVGKETYAQFFKRTEGWGSHKNALKAAKDGTINQNDFMLDVLKSDKKKVTTSSDEFVKVEGDVYQKKPKGKS